VSRAMSAAEAYVRQLRRIVEPGNERVVRAFADVDRADFLEGFYLPRNGWTWVAADQRPLPDEVAEHIYRNEALTTALAADGLPASSSSMPALMMRMLDLLSVSEGMRVLEIGAGTGYNAALLAFVVGERGFVSTVEITAELAAVAAARVGAATAVAGFGRVEVVHGDGAQGWPPDAPYDRLIATAGCGGVPGAWWDQLRDDGLALVPLAHGAGFPLVALRPEADRGRWSGRYVGHAGFMAATGDGECSVADRTVCRLADSVTMTVHPLDATPQQIEDLIFFCGLELAELQPLRVVGRGLGGGAVVGVGWRNAATGGATVLGGTRLYSGNDDRGLARVRDAADRWVEAGRPGLDRFRMRLDPADQPPRGPRPGALRSWSIARGPATQTVDLTGNADRHADADD
jgi:protein-L-isoaspartate(D-aspartate) O-methyltransferase